MAGFYAEGHWKNDLRVQFDVVDINHPESRLLCTDEPRTGYSKAGRFYFDPAAIRWGEALLQTENRDPKCLSVLDEVGKFELNHLVWYPALKSLLDNCQPVLITVRSEMLHDLIQEFGIREPRVFGLEQAQKKVARTIAGQLGYF